MQTEDRPAEWLRLSEVVTAATVIAGSLSVASYAFALGYVFAIEPRFLPALSFGDLLLLFTSSTSTAIFAAMVAIPCLAVLIAPPMWLSKRAREFPAPPKQPGGEQSEEELKERAYWESYRKAFKARRETVIVIVMSFMAVMLFVSFQDWLEGRDTPSSPFMGYFMAVGCMLGLMITTRYLMHPVMPLILALYILASFYLVGDLTGRRDLLGSAESRGMPCVFLKERSDCLDGLLVGSQAVIGRKNGRIVLVSRDDVKSVQSREAAMLILKYNSKAKN